MINKQLINPESIVVVGGSDDVSKPGGKVLKNIIDGGFKGRLYVVNIKHPEVQGIKAYQNISGLPEVDLAIIVVASKYVYDIVKELTEFKNTKAFIVISAGFSEESEKGRILEKKIVEQVNKHGAVLIGPNCIGVLTPKYHGVFTLPIPKLEPDGCDFISGSGATSCFIMDAGIPKGLTFANVFSVGNSAQIGVEEILQYLDENYAPGISSDVKLLYIENIRHPQLLLKHASSLVKKGCKIAAIKTGVSEEGSRAATSHTGALARPDAAVDALFVKAGIVRCYSREEIITVASVFKHPELKGENIAVITHAGGPAVMITDALIENGLEVPPLEGDYTKELKEQLFPGSAVTNPVDFLATGTAGQLGTIIDYIDNKFDNIDAMVVIFGTPGLFPIHDVYKLLDEKMRTCKKPIFPVLPSTLTAKYEVNDFLDKGRINFPDEVLLGRALGKVYHTMKPVSFIQDLKNIRKLPVREVINSSGEGYLSPESVNKLLKAVDIPVVGEKIATSEEETAKFCTEFGFPVVMKAVGILHKSDLGGVILDIWDEKTAKEAFDKLTRIKGVNKVLIQPMVRGTEVFLGAKYEEGFGHLIMCGLGGIFVEVLKDVTTALAPIGFGEALNLLKRLKSYKILEGVRGQPGTDIPELAKIIVKLSNLVTIAPEISEMDINPLICEKNGIFAVDARISVSK
ncbi:MAG: acetate--CoA ligase family protein [Bacteroidales bacterium]|nr:acetate--CoA ligase family protein [Bacteroidales bacterium]